MKYFLLLVIVTQLISCASGPREYKELDRAVEKHDFQNAVNIIEKGQRREIPVYSRRNAVLLYLDKGLLEHYAGNYEASSESLQTAERLIEEAYTKSITENFLSYIVNDNTKEYPGEDFEDIYLNVFNALNYYNRGDLEGALVEIRKLTISNGKLDLLARKYEYTDPKTGAGLQSMLENETGVSQLPETRTVSFSNSALARYLSFLFYQGIGDIDAARIEFDQIERAFNTNKDIYYFPVPYAVEEANDIPSGKGRLNILSFTGLSPIKEEEKITHYLPFMNPAMRVAVFKLPVLKRRHGAINKIEVIVNDSEIFELELLEDIGSVIEDTYNARFSNILLKTYIRTIIKYVTTDVASAAALASDEDFGILAWLFITIGGRIAADTSERADIRMSRYLPEKAHIGGINLDPGTYSVIINYYNGYNIIMTEEYNDVIVGKDRLNLLHSVVLK